MVSALLFDPIIVSPPDPVSFLRKGAGRLVLGAGSLPRSTPHSETGEKRLPRPEPSSAPQVYRSRFRRLYQRCDLPIAVEQDRPGRIGLRWKQPVHQLDVLHLLPIFLEGLREEQASGPLCSNENFAEQSNLYYAQPETLPQSRSHTGCWQRQGR